MSNSIVRKRIQPDTKNVGFIKQDDTELLRVPVSSTSEDRDGDMFSQDGLQRQLEQLESGAVKMFPDHGLDDMGHPVYRFSDIMGKWVGGEIEENTLYGLAELREGDSNADELRDLVEQDMPVGFSVGFGVKEESATETENGHEFDDADLMEVSPVGIESNPDAVIGAAVAKAVGESDSPEDAIADLTTAIKNMSDEEPSDPPEEEGKDTETEAKEDDYEDEEEEEKQMDSEMVDEVFNAVSEAFSNALEEARDDLVENSDDEEDEDKEEDEEDDEEEMSADAKALVEKMEDQSETIDELRAKVESLESKSREAGEKKGMVPTESKEPEEESETKAPEAPEDFYENLA